MVAAVGVGTKGTGCRTHLSQGRRGLTVGPARERWGKRDGKMEENERGERARACTRMYVRACASVREKK